MLNTCLVFSLGLLFYFRMKEDSNFHSLMDAIHLRVECARLKFPDFIAKVSTLPWLLDPALSARS